MTSEPCKHELPPDQCGDCRPPPPGLTARVVITRGGQVFHRTAACGLLRDGQRFADWLGQDVHEAVHVPLVEAQSMGRAACSACFPDYKPNQAQPSGIAYGDRAAHLPAQTHGPDNDPLQALAEALNAASRAIAAALAAGADRARLTDLVAHAMIDMRAQVWPDAAPPSRARER